MQGRVQRDAPSVARPRPRARTSLRRPPMRFEPPATRGILLVVDEPLKTVNVTILTALTCETEAVLHHLDDPRPIVIGDSIANVGRLRGSDGRCEVTVVELGPGNIQTAVEAGRVRNDGSTDILLFVGIAGALKDLGLGDVVAASEVAYVHRAKIVDGERLGRPQVNRCTRILVQVARHTAREKSWQERLATAVSPAPRALVGQILSSEELVKDSAYRDELKRTYSDALAVENEGYGLSHVGGSTLKTIVVRGASDDADEKKSDSDQARAADAAAAFAAQMLLDYLAIVHAALMPSSQGPTSSGGESTTGARTFEVSAETIETIRADIDLVEDSEADVVAFANAEFDRLTEDSRAALCARLGSELNDESQSEGLITRRMNWFARAFAARAIAEGLAVDWDHTLSSTPAGGAIMLGQVGVIDQLSSRVRRRVVSGLVGAVDHPQAMSVSRAASTVELKRAEALGQEEMARVELSEDATPYDTLRDGGWTWREMFRKFVTDLTSGNFDQQNAATRFLTRSGSPHLVDGNFEPDEQRQLINLIVSAGRHGAFGAQDATTVSKMSEWPTHLLAEALWSDMTNGGSRLDMPRTELKTVLSAALLSSRLSVVLDDLLQSGRGRTLDPVRENSAEEDRAWLITQGSKLPDEAREAWSSFVDALYAQVPRM